jgi:hypothetical protein
MSSDSWKAVGFSNTIAVEKYSSRSVLQLSVATYSLDLGQSSRAWEFPIIHRRAIQLLRDAGTTHSNFPQI